MAQILQQQWAQAGIKANINSQEQASAIKDILVGKLQAATGPNFGFPDPDYNYIFWHSSYTGPIGALSINFPHMKSDAVDKGLYTGRVNLVPSIRKDAYQQAVRAMNENNTYVWLYRYVAALIAQNHIHGLGQAEQLGFTGLQFHNWYGNLWVDKQ
jgi:ABC-type transport system substrate-binding protein